VRHRGQVEEAGALRELGQGGRVQPGGGLPAMAISCGGPAFNLDAKFLTDKVRPRLVGMVRRIEASLGS